MTPTTPASFRIHPGDSVAVALRDLLAGEEGATEAIGRGHKFALRDIGTGETVCKYGQPIGRATRAIKVGEHVHVHNLATALAGELTYSAASGADESRTNNQDNDLIWRGYLRSDGRAATRNEIWILPTVGCVGMTAEQIAREAQSRHEDAVDGIYAFAHPHGCSQLGDDLDGTRALLAGLASNPNAAGVLILGLGCESNQIDELVSAVPENARGKLRTLSSQSAGDEMAEAARLIDELVEAARTATRIPLPLSALTVGVKCGGSDGFSGLTANPLLGRFSETLSSAGGSIVLTEIPEIFGAEQALFERAVSPDVFDAAAGLVNRFKRYYIEQGHPVSENPSPGNIAGGITTLEEKSLGAVQKAGRAPLVDVIDYGRQATRAGVTLLEAPGNDAVSSSALAAAGANLIMFTTGRGTPLGFPVPTVKVSSNRQLAEAKQHWIDFDASAVFEEGREAVDAEFLARILAFASGERTASERHGQRAIAVWKRGVTL